MSVSKDFLKVSDAELIPLMENLVLKLPAYVVTFSLSATTVATLVTDLAFLKYSVNVRLTAKDVSKQLTELNKLFLFGLATQVLSLPGLTFPAPPAVLPAPGLYQRLRALANQIKNHPKYTPAIGDELGITRIGGGAVDPTTLIPEIKVLMTSAGVLIKWIKGQADALRIEVDRGAGTGWELLSIDTQPDYLDTHTLPATDTAVLWKYRASYMIADNLVGQWSATVSIAVKG